MKIAAMSASDIRGSLRFDSKYHLSRHNPLLQDLARSGLPFASIQDRFSKDQVWCGNIFGRIYASDPDAGKPLLVPYDIFRYVPWSDKILSRSQVAQFDRLQIKRGTLMIVCSGRNLGPATIADAFCERFVMSHDMIRIEDNLSDELIYLAAFLRTSYGQAVIRTDMNGSVIDHTDANQMRALRYPVISNTVYQKVVEWFREGFLKRESARLGLDDLKNRYAAYFDITELSASFSSDNFVRRFTRTKSEIGLRIDAEANAPQYATYRSGILASGGVTLNTIARVYRPASRYKTNYVDDASYGIPLMNGRQISQYQAIALRLMNVAGIKNSESFQLTKGMTLITADGRAEENLADCVMVAGDRQGWGASGHVHRIEPREGVNAGLVYLACACEPVQAQFKALSTGSVVDALSETDVAAVIVPYSHTAEAAALGDEAVSIWDLFAEASALEMRAIEAIEDAIRSRAKDSLLHPHHA